MTIFDEIQSPQETHLLVGFFDLTRFLHFAKTHTNQEIFETLSAYFEFVGDIVENSGGKVVKFIGDAGLIVYPESHVNQGVLALKTLKEAGDAWLTEHNVASRNLVTAHFGPVFCGPLGTHTDKRFDVMGDTVNIAVTIKSTGLAITPQLFRKLDADTRKLFKKHTPPITYISVTDKHKD